MIGAVLTAAALLPALSFAQGWTISETANVGGQNYAHVYHTVLTSGTTLTAPLTVGWNDCLTVYSRVTTGTVSATVPDSITWVASPVAISTTTAAVSYTLLTATNVSASGIRSPISGPVRTLYGQLTACQASGCGSVSTTLEVAQTKCSNR